jgi:pimeloyl-ACP methyl ester carboxylesterase
MLLFWGGIAMKRTTVLGAIAAAGGALTYANYRKESREAALRIRSGRRMIDSPNGPIEIGESGVGPAVLMIHGAGGGFDQGLDVARAFVGDGYRIIAPSRFGYLATRMPSDASPEAQADAYVRVLDALELERVPVIAISAGGPSAIQFCLRHPDRCSALVLIVPLAFAPDRGEDRRLSATIAMLLNTLLRSDFLFWAATKVARSELVETILGTPASVYSKAAPEVRQAVDQTLQHLLPISKRAKGLVSDSVVASTLTRYALEKIEVPTLAISCEDDGYRTYEAARYTALQIRDGRFIGYSSGGHLLVGHDEEVRTEIRSFLSECLVPTRKTTAVDEAVVLAHAEALV